MQDTINYGTRDEEKKITAVGLNTVSAQREPLAEAFILRPSYVIRLPLHEADKSPCSQNTTAIDNHELHKNLACCLHGYFHTYST